MKDSNIEIVESYWNRIYSKFDAIYTRQKNPILTILDKVFRRDMFLRYKKVFESCGAVNGKMVCDVGCGTGRYSIAFAKLGAKEVVGIDIAHNMVQFARDLAAKEGLDTICHFEKADILDYAPQKYFDIIVSIGVFDYIKDPLEMLKKIRSLLNGHGMAIITFPRYWTWRRPVRKLRLKIDGCPVYFYTRKEVNFLMREASFKQVYTEVLGKIFFSIGH